MGMQPRFILHPGQTMSQRAFERLWQLIVHRDVDLIEVSSGMLFLGWGIQLLLPWSTFGSSSGYVVLAQLMSEPVWGTLLLWLGITKIGSYLLNQRRVRLAGSLVGSMTWAFFSVAFGVANPAGTGIVVYPFLSLLSALIFWRVFTHRERDE
jgi:hypothetical protein